MRRADVGIAALLHQRRERVSLRETRTRKHADESAAARRPALRSVRATPSCHRANRLASARSPATAPSPATYPPNPIDELPTGSPYPAARPTFAHFICRKLDSSLPPVVV